MLPHNFLKAIEQTYKDALAKADQIINNAEITRGQANAELDAAKEVRKKAEQEADVLARRYYEDRQTQFREAAHIELLRNLTRKHLEEGRKCEEIVEWLSVTPEFVQQINTVLHHIKGKSNPGRPLKGDPKIHYSNTGRGGTVHFVNGPVRFDLWWEFAGGDAVAIVDIPSEKDWEKRTGLKMEERKETIHFISDQIIQDQLSGKGTYIIGEHTLTFYSGR